MNSLLEVLSNNKITRDMYLMKLACSELPLNGQFCMIKVPNSFMTLYRPFSIFDADGEVLSLLYSPRGEGTRLMTKVRSGEKLEVTGFYGNSWEEIKDKTLLIVGGIGLAPLYKIARESASDFYIGFQKDAYNEEELANVRELLRGTQFHIVLGGYVSDSVDFSLYDRVYTCGPEPMYRTLNQRHDRVYASFERHMACAVGACRACSVISHGEGGAETKSVCQDGPIFELKSLGEWE